ncbi:MAG: hypothetical protein AB1649_24855, partial [Chloroflexota bacterium]
ASLKQQLPEIDDIIRYVQPIILDDVAVKLGPWSGYNVLAHYPEREEKDVEQSPHVRTRELVLGGGVRSASAATRLDGLRGALRLFLHYC